jgi:hypothetical protein
MRRMEDPGEAEGMLEAYVTHAFKYAEEHLPAVSLVCREEQARAVLASSCIDTNTLTFW